MPTQTHRARLLHRLLNSASEQQVGADESLDIGEARWVSRLLRASLSLAQRPAARCRQEWHAKCVARLRDMG